MFARRSVGTFAAVVAALGLLQPPAAARAQVPGENVNMVSGTTYPGGDPFLQRQNEPSIAVSSANPLHLLAGANDYRSVDLSVAVTKMPGDAWLGVFKSLDGGVTWRSTLLPGYPGDGSPEGLASPIHGFSAAADPVVRAGPAGMLYYSGIAFDRATNLGQVFVARFHDRNDKEDGNVVAGTDPVRFLGAVTIDTGTAGQFLDKPWMAVDAPVAGAPACALPGGGPSIPAGRVYLTYAAFTGSNEQSSKILIVRSDDCGQTWSKPVKVSESNSVNQGTVIAIDPATHNVYVAWRRFATTSDTDAILVARSTDGGATFSKGVEVAAIVPFDQSITPTRFRTATLPSLAVSVGSDGVSRVHVAWSERGAPGGDARIVLATSTDGVAWSTPVAVDATPVRDDAGNELPRGHQVMPALSFSQGRLLVLYYDSRLSHVRSYFQPNSPFAPDPLGRFYTEIFAPRGELVSSPTPFLGSDLDDASFTQVRHTLDVRVAQATAGPALSFTSARVSRFRFGTRGDETVPTVVPGFTGQLTVVEAAGSGDGQVRLLQQLQLNPPNLPLFRQGTVPFMGDYVDIAGIAFLPSSGAPGGWEFATRPVATPVHHAVWTSNQDVRPPADGDWTHYTPVGARAGVPTSFDPTQAHPTDCLPGQEGMRNQNVYSARITDGLSISSPQNVKPLSETVRRAFVVSVSNATDLARTVRLVVDPPPAGVSASFRADSALPLVEVVVPPHSAIARSLFARLLPGSWVPTPGPATTLVVRVLDGARTAACPAPAAPCAWTEAGSVTFNPPGSAPSLRTPDSSTVDPLTGEVYMPSITPAEVTSPNVDYANVSTANISTANVTTANVTTANVSTANVTTANVTTTHVANPDLANISTANVSTANVSTANVSTANISTANVSTANVTTSAVSDANYTIRNEGNTAHSYTVRVVGTLPAGTPLQLVLARPSFSPISLGCRLYDEPRYAVVTNVGDVSPAVIPPHADIADPLIPEGSPANATFALAPGEWIQVTLRGRLTAEQMAELSAGLVPAIVPHAGGSFTAPLLIASDGGNLPSPQVGRPYGVTLKAIGGTAPYVWELVSAPAGSGFSISTQGTISWVPQAPGTFAFTVRLRDAVPAHGQATRTISLEVVKGPTTTAATASPNPAWAYQPVSLRAVVRPDSTLGPTPLGRVSFVDASTAQVLGSAPAVEAADHAAIADLRDVAALGLLAPGQHPVVATFTPGTGVPFLSSSTTTTLQVLPGPVAVAVAPDPPMPYYGQPFRYVASVVRGYATGSGSPAPSGGTVTFRDGGGNVLGTARLVDGAASIAAGSLGPGSHAVVAAYDGDASATGASSPLAEFVVRPAATSTSLTASLASPTYRGQAVTFVAAVAVTGGAASLAGTVTFQVDAEPPVQVPLVSASGGASGTLTRTDLSAGSHAISAWYGGGPSLAASPAASLGHDVVVSGTTTSLETPRSTPVFGEPITLTATVRRLPAPTWPGAPVPSGTVNLSDGTAPAGSGVLSGGTALLDVPNLVLTDLPVGTHVFHGGYAGDFWSGASTSGPLQVTVGRAATATTLVASPSPSVAGQDVTFTAQVSVTAPGRGVPGGNVTFLEGKSVLGTRAVLGGSATFTTGALAVGTHAVTAAYEGDASFGPSGSGATTQVVTRPQYRFSGFFTPLATAGTLAQPSTSPQQKFGSAIPIKWSLADPVTGALVTSLSSARLIKVVENVACSGAPPVGAKETLLYSPTTGATGGSTFRFSTSQFVFTWDTSKLGIRAICYTIVLVLDDDSPARATNVKLK